METDFMSYAQGSVNSEAMIYGGDERWSKVFLNQFPQEQPQQMRGCTQQCERTQGLYCSQRLTRTHHHLLMCLIPQYSNAKITWLHHNTVQKSYTLDVCPILT